MPKRESDAALASEKKCRLATSSPPPFRHETSREQDPQLHSHCVVINATQLEDGKWQSLSNEEVLNNQKLLG